MALLCLREQNEGGGVYVLKRTSHYISVLDTAANRGRPLLRLLFVGLALHLTLSQLSHQRLVHWLQHWLRRRRHLMHWPLGTLIPELIRILFNCCKIQDFSFKF